MAYVSQQQTHRDASPSKDNIALSQTPPKAPDEECSQSKPVGHKPRGSERQDGMQTTARDLEEEKKSKKRRKVNHGSLKLSGLSGFAFANVLNFEACVYCQRSVSATLPSTSLTRWYIHDRTKQCNIGLMLKVALPSI